MSNGKWQFWIDRGGTFTDVVARDPEGRYLTHKLLSEAPERYSDAALQGIRELVGVRGDEPIPATRVAAVKMGTTVATNALLERKGERVVLLVTRGFGDALRIGNQTRPHLFKLDIPDPHQSNGDEHDHWDGHPRDQRKPKPGHKDQHNDHGKHGRNNVRGYLRNLLFNGGRWVSAHACADVTIAHRARNTRPGQTRARGSQPTTTANAR